MYLKFFGIYSQYNFGLWTPIGSFITLPLSSRGWVLVIGGDLLPSFTKLCLTHNCGLGPNRYKRYLSQVMTAYNFGFDSRKFIWDIWFDSRKYVRYLTLQRMTCHALIPTERKVLFCVVGVEKGKNFLFALLGGKRGKVRLFESLPPTGEKSSPVVCTAPWDKGRL